MPAARIEAALRERVSEPLICWCNGQSLESRYSTSAPPRAGGAVPNAGAGVILRHQLGKATRPDAVPMPRFPVIALTADVIYVFDGPVPEEEPLAKLDRARVGVVYGGSRMWRRIDLIVHDEPSRSYTMMVSGLAGSRKRLARLVAELEKRQPA
jgi:hypothetical protein